MSGDLQRVSVAVADGAPFARIVLAHVGAERFSKVELSAGLGGERGCDNDQHASGNFFHNYLLFTISRLEAP